MSASLGVSTAIPNNERVHGRQIAFLAAFLLPVSKFLEAPSLLAKYAAGDLLLPALFHFLLQATVLFLLLLILSRSEIPLTVRLEQWLGKWIVIPYALFAAYFLYAAAIPLYDLEKFVYAIFFDTEPTFFSFLFFFFFSAFLCTKGLKGVGRIADICLFLFLIPFLALLVMSLWETEFSRLLPLFGSKFSDTVSAFTRTTPHFSDAVLLLPLLANTTVKKKDGIQIMSGYALGALFVCIFLAVFFGTYSSLAAREHYAFAKIAQYFPALSVIGRADLLFIYLLSITLLFYTCLPLLYTTDLLGRIFHTQRHAWLSAILSFLLFLLILFTNQYYNSIYRFITGAPFIFWLIADILPLFCFFVPKNLSVKPSQSPDAPTQPNPKSNALKKEKTRA